MRRSYRVRVQGCNNAKVSTDCILTCTLGFVPAVVPLISPAYDFYPGIKIAAGIFNCSLGYSGFGCGLYNVLAGKLFPVCKQVKYQLLGLFGLGGGVPARAR